MPRKSSSKPPAEKPADVPAPVASDLLREIEQLYQTAPIGLALLDAELRFVRVNDRIAALTGKSIEEHRGRTFNEILPAAERAQSILREVVETGRDILDVETEVTLPAAPAKELCWLASYHALRDPAGAIAGVSVVVQDITSRKQAETSLADRLRFETLLADFSTRFINLPADAVDGHIQSGLRQIVEFFGVDRSTLAEFSEDGKTLRPTHSWAVAGVEKTPVVNVDVYFRWAVAQLRAGEVYRFSRPEDLPDEAVGEKAYCAKTGFTSSMGIPLTIGGELRGAIMAGSFGVERRWPAIAVQRLRLFGEIIANALQRKWADEALGRSYDEIKALKEQLEAERDYLREEIHVIHNHEEVVGQSEPIRKVLALVEQVAPRDSTVLVVGETGTGKELIARAIHNLSSRKGRAMVKVNCSALPSTLVESELFGREKGAYTGALTRQLGRFEIANGSTIFLDEIGELPLDLQAKLLRVLQEGDFERLGSAETIHVAVRVIAATNRDLLKEVRAGKFREDLYYRLNVFPIVVPPLRERVEDLPLLVWSFVKQFSETMGTTIERIPRADMEALARYPWPGNVRELRNVVERAMIMRRGPTLRIEAPSARESSSPAGMTLEAYERDHILKVLERTGWRIRGKNGAAEILGLKPTTLYSRMEKLGIKKPASV